MAAPCWFWLVEKDLDKETQIADMLRPTVEAMGTELWGLEYLVQGKHVTLRIFIDKDGGVSIDDCEQVSRQVSALMDVEDPIGNAYTLEVSSPGLDRFLFEKAHFEAYIGSLIKVRLRMNFEGRRNYKGRLTAVENDEIVLLQDQEEFVFPLETLEKSQVIPEFGSGNSN